MTEKNTASSSESVTDCNAHSRLTAACATVLSADNAVDDDAIVVITTDACPYDITCHVADLKGLVLDCSGDYRIRFIDRVGNSFEQRIHIDDSESKTHMTEGHISYEDLYNLVHIHDR